MNRQQPVSAPFALSRQSTSRNPTQTQFHCRRWDGPYKPLPNVACRQQPFVATTFQKLTIFRPKESEVNRGTATKNFQVRRSRSDHSADGPIFRLKCNICNLSQYCDPHITMYCYQSCMANVMQPLLSHGQCHAIIAIAWPMPCNHCYHLPSANRTCTSKDDARRMCFRRVPVAAPITNVSSAKSACIVG